MARENKVWKPDSIPAHVKASEINGAIYSVPTIKGAVYAKSVLEAKYANMGGDVATAKSAAAAKFVSMAGSATIANLAAGQEYASMEGYVAIVNRVAETVFVNMLGCAAPVRYAVP